MGRARRAGARPSRRQAAAAPRSRSPPRRPQARSGASPLANPGSANDRRPRLPLGDAVGVHLRRGHRGGHDGGERLEPRPHLRRLNDAVHRLVDRRHDLIGRARRRRDRVPSLTHESVEPGLAHGGRLGERREALRSRHAERPDRAALHLPDRRQRRIDEGQPPGDKIDHRLRAPRTGHALADHRLKRHCDDAGDDEPDGASRGPGRRAGEAARKWKERRGEAGAEDGATADHLSLLSSRLGCWLTSSRRDLARTAPARGGADPRGRVARAGGDRPCGRAAAVHLRRPRTPRRHRLRAAGHGALRHRVLFFGAAGSALLRLGLGATPLVLGFVLGPSPEEYVRRTLLMSRGDATVFVTDRVSAACIAIAVGGGVVCVARARSTRPRRR